MPVCFVNMSLTSMPDILASSEEGKRYVLIDGNTAEILNTKVKNNYLEFSKSTGRYKPQCKGSLPKAFMGNNRGRFTFEGLCNTVAKLEEITGLSASEMELHSFEFEINIFTNKPIANFISKTLCYRNLLFSDINRYTYGIGKSVKVGSSRVFKLYDKNRADLAIATKNKNFNEINSIKQSCDKNILRVGVRILEMRYVKEYGIITLADLLNIDKVIALTKIIYSNIANIRFMDSEADLSILSSEAAKRYLRLCCADNWQGLTFREREKENKFLKRVLPKLNIRNYNLELLQMCFAEFVKIFEADNPKNWRCLRKLQRAFKNSEADKLAMFTDFISFPFLSPKVIKGEAPKKKKSTRKKHSIKLNQKNKKCEICGRDISMQKSGSRFCSEILFGKDAKRCRNKANNQKRREKTKQARLKEKLLLERLKQKNPEQLRFIVCIQDKDRIKYARPTYSKLTTWDKGTIKRIKSVRITWFGTLTTLRARAFVRYLISNSKS